MYIYICHAIRMLISSKGWCTTITSCGVISFRMTDDQFTTKPRSQVRANLKQQTMISSCVVHIHIKMAESKQQFKQPTLHQLVEPEMKAGTFVTKTPLCLSLPAACVPSPHRHIPWLKSVCPIFNSGNSCVF